jgi:hypothetical protein
MPQQNRRPSRNGRGGDAATGRGGDALRLRSRVPGKVCALSWVVPGLFEGGTVGVGVEVFGAGFGVAGCGLVVAG